jgi:hypothetical protein
MLSPETRRTIATIVAGCFVWVACGGSSSDGTGATVAGAGGSAGATGVTGTGGTAGTSTGTGGAPAVDGGRVACGTANMSTGCNPNGNNRVCDLPNNRCVQCTSDANCAANPMQMGNPHCDTVGLNNAMLPNDTCEECLTDAHCGANMACLNNNCVATCTTDAGCLAASPMTPVCNLAGMPPRCVQCLTDAQCATAVDGNGVPRPHCRLPMTQNALTCRACVTAADCMPGQTCSNGGNCNNPMDGGMMGARDGGGRGGMMDATPVLDATRGD